MMLLGNDDVLELAPSPMLIDTMEAAFASEGHGPERFHRDLPGDDDAKLLIMPAWLGREAIGVKVATVVPANRDQGRPTIDGLYVLLDGQTGAPRAVIGAAALTAVRTAAVSGLASRRLAPRRARTLLMVGTGALAPHLIAAHLSVRPVTTLLIWGRDSSKAERLAAQFGGGGLAVEVAADLDAAIARADIVSAATSSLSPLIRAASVRPHAHIDLVGSFTPAMREADSALFALGALVVDTRDAFAESGDLIAPTAEGLISAARTPTLADLVRGSPRSHMHGKDISIFKSVGTGLADIAAARFIVESAIAKGVTGMADNSC